MTSRRSQMIVGFAIALLAASITLAADATLVYLSKIATGSLPAAAAGNKGALVYDSTTDEVKVSDGSAWNAIGGGSSPVSIAKVEADVVNTTTTLADVTGLSWSVAANTAYGYVCYLVVHADLADIRWTNNGPASPTINHMLITRQGNANSQAENLDHDSPGKTNVAYETTTNPLSYPSVGEDHWVRIFGMFHNGANAGTFVLRFAVSTGSSTTITVKEGSWCQRFITN